MDEVFNKFFKELTGNQPFPWQESLAASTNCRDRSIRIPTGLGKTQGVLAAWSFHRLICKDDQWPRRLTWCLPMRVLVEQTLEVAKNIAKLLPEAVRPRVHVAMGGEDTEEWFLYPEEPMIIIGTQDMLLSRALNRGYASARARWPVEFGLLNHDALWVMDEVQLMDAGLATSAQLQAYREQDRSKHLRPCHTWWMSATLQPDWLRSPDTEEFHQAWTKEPCTVPFKQRNGGLWSIHKSVTTANFAADDHSGFAERILEEHAKLSDGPFGNITLVICNTVKRACETFDALQAAGRTDGMELVHSRFRPAERRRWRDEFLSREHCRPGVDRIIVATQVVEAGVDISSGCLITELAPWPSLVQRFGRCARYGGSGRVLVVDRDHDDKQSAPYEPAELESAWETIQQLPDVSIAALEAYEDSLAPEARGRLYPYAPKHLLLRKEFDELFDTTPDLTGADIDISRFIRSGEERDLQVFWIDIPEDKKGEPKHEPSKDRQPHRLELCTVPFLQARDWLCGEESKTNRRPRLRGGMRSWVWDWIDGEWKIATREMLLPGRVICVSADSGGYCIDRGFDSDASAPVPPVDLLPPIPKDVKALDLADGQQNGELPGDCWKTIAFHDSEVATTAKGIGSALGLSTQLLAIIELFGIWHDWGKSHPAFQGAMGKNRPPNHLDDLAKAPRAAWRKGETMYRYLDGTETRPTFRHELASALGLIALLKVYKPDHAALLGPWRDALAHIGQQSTLIQPPASSPLVQRILDCSAEDFDLLVYLIASHHGKVRVALHASPQDQDYVVRDNDHNGLPIRGIRENDTLPFVALVPNEPPIPSVTLTLSPASMGLSKETGISWRERALGVIERFGPGGLAFLEAVLRAADVRASRMNTTDPALATEVQR